MIIFKGILKNTKSIELQTQPSILSIILALPEDLIFPLHVLLEVDQRLTIGLPVMVHHGVDAPEIGEGHNSDGPAQT